MHVLMFGSGRLSAGRASKQIRRLVGDGEAARVGAFRGSGDAVPLLDWEDVPAWFSTKQGLALYVHDDVDIDRGTIETLADAHRSSGTTVAGGIASPPAAAAHVPVLLGSPSALGEMFRQPLSTPDVAAYDTLDIPGIRHAGSCTRQAQPLLVASMIVRDEAENLPKCLASLAGLVDRIEVVDTGSTDETISIARGYGANVTHATWDDDFSSARNVALDRARDARFALQIDADEWVDVEDPHDFRARLAGSRLRAVRLPIRNISKGRVTSTFEAVRVFSTSGTRWIGRVHEYPAERNGKPMSAGHLPGLSLWHGGYDPQLVAEKDKHNRNVTLAEAGYRADPCFKTRMDFARSLAWKSDDARAYAMFREAASDMSEASEPAAAFVVAHVALADQLEGDLDGAHRNAEEAIRLCNGEFVAHLARARAWKAQGNDAAIIQAHSARLDSQLDPPMFDTAASRHLTDTLTVGALGRLGRHVDAIELAVTVVGQAPERFDEWKSFVSMPVELRRAGLLLLASMDSSGGFVDGLVGEIPMDELGALALAHVESQQPEPHVVITGIMAALIAQDEETAIRIARQGSAVLDDEQRLAAAERCRLRGADSVAAALESTPATV